MTENHASLLYIRVHPIQPKSIALGMEREVRSPGSEVRGSQVVERKP